MIVKIWLGAALLANAAVTNDLDGLRALTTWNVSAQQELPGGASERCNIRDPRRYETTRLDHQTGSDIDGTRATNQIRLLDHRIVAFLREHDWVPAEGQSGHFGLDSHRCYEKEKTIVHIFETTSYCKMNSPCNEFNGIGVVVYQPKLE